MHMPHMPGTPSRRSAWAASCSMRRAACSTLTTPEPQSGAATDRNGTTTLPEQEPGACRPACAAAHRGTDWARRLSVCKAHGGYANKAGPSCCTFETATSVLALPYGQAPNPCHPAPSRARRRGTGCCNGSAPPSGELTPSVCASASVHQARRPSPRISAADRPDRRKPTPGGGRLSTALAPAALKCPMCLGLQSSVFAPT